MMPRKITSTCRLLSIAAATFPLSVAPAQTDSVLCPSGLILSHPTNNITWAAKAVGNTLYIADGIDGLHILDVSDLSAPVMLGSYDLPTSSRNIWIRDTTAYVSDRYLGLQIVDVSDPGNAIVRGSIRTASTIDKLKWIGALALVHDGASNLSLLDFSDPTSPSIAHTIPFANTVSDFDVRGSVAAVCVRDAGILLFDMSNPFSPTLLGTYGAGTWFRHVAMSESGLAIAYTHQNYEVHCFDFIDPSAPVLLSTFLAPYSVADIVVDDTTAIVAIYDSGIWGIDIADPGSPRLAWSAPTSNGAEHIAVIDDRLLVADHQAGLLIYDLNAMPQTPITGLMSFSSGSGSEVIVQDDVAFVAAVNAGMQLIDVSDPAHPTLIAAYDTTESHGIDVLGDLVYLVDLYPGLLIFDASDPSAPALVGSYNTPGAAYDVAVDGSFAYVADDDQGIQIVDISDPSNPFRLSRVGYSDDIRNVTVHDGICYGLSSSDLYIYDVHNPAAPFRIGVYYVPPFEATDSFAVGTTLFLAGGRTGVHVLDVSNPASPQLLSNIDTGYASNVRVRDNQLFVTGADDGLRVYDISDLQNAILLGRVQPSYTTIGLAVSGDLAYVGTQNGLAVIDIGPCDSCPADLNADGGLNFFDLQTYLNLYATQDPAADWNDDGSFNFFDVQSYLNAYADGCP